MSSLTSPVFGASTVVRENAESGRELGRGDPSFDDCLMEFGLVVPDYVFGLPLSDVCDFPEAGLEEGCACPDSGRDHNRSPEDGLLVFRGVGDFWCQCSVTQCNMT